MSDLETFKLSITNGVADGGDAHTPHNQAQSLDGRLVQTNISSATDTEIIPQELQKGNPKNRLMINIYGSAGVGKTTFAKKLQEFIVEYQKENLKYNKFEPQFNPALVGEYATMLINDSKFDELRNQPLVTKGQISLINEAFKKSSMVISESPVELGRIYNEDYTKAKEVTQLVNACEACYMSVNLFIKHDEKSKETYSMQGRVHTYEESLFKEKELLDNLKAKNTPFIVIDRNVDLETLFAHIQNTPEYRVFEVRQETIKTSQKLFSSSEKSKNTDKEIG